MQLKIEAIAISIRGLEPWPPQGPDKVLIAMAFLFGIIK